MAFDISKIKFDARGLVPCIVQDADTGRVLTLAYMNRESLGITLERGLCCFWSRSRQELWLKGESSGNYQHVLSLEADCDADALLARVRKDGPACHLGTDSCFDTEIRADFAPALSQDPKNLQGSQDSKDPKVSKVSKDFHKPEKGDAS